MRFALVPLALAVTTLTACGSNDAVSTDSENGETSALAGAESTSSDGFPAGFSLYPGATVISKEATNLQGREGSVWTIQTPDTPEQIITHYVNESKAAGLEVGKINQEGTAFFFTGKRASDMGEILASANRAPGADVTTINMTIVSN